MPVFPSCRATWAGSWKASANLHRAKLAIGQCLLNYSSLCLVEIIVDTGRSPHGLTWMQLPCELWLACLWVPLHCHVPWPTQTTSPSCPSVPPCNKTLICPAIKSPRHVVEWEVTKWQWQWHIYAFLFINWTGACFLPKALMKCYTNHFIS